MLERMGATAGNAIRGKSVAAETDSEAYPIGDGGGGGRLFGELTF